MRLKRRMQPPEPVRPASRTVRVPRPVLHAARIGNKRAFIFFNLLIFILILLVLLLLVLVLLILLILFLLVLLLILLVLNHFLHI